MVVYHGTDSISARRILELGIDVKCNNGPVDNGPGFYTTPNRKFAARRAVDACRKIRFKRPMLKVAPVLLELEIEIQNINGITTKEFVGVTPEWKEFIFYNRLTDKAFNTWNIESNNHNRDGKYDVVWDETADAGISGIISSARRNSDGSDLEQYIEQIDISSDPDWGRQISFHTDLSVEKCIQVIRIIQLDADDLDV